MEGNEPGWGGCRTSARDGPTRRRSPERAGSAAGGGPGAGDDGQDGVDGGVEVVVDDELRAEGLAGRDLLGGVFQPPRDLVGRIAPTPEALLLHLTRWGGDEDQERVRV